MSYAETMDRKEQTRAKSRINGMYREVNEFVAYAVARFGKDASEWPPHIRNKVLVLTGNAERLKQENDVAA